MTTEEKILQQLEQMNTRFDALEGRFDTLEVKVDALEVRFDTLETKVDAIDARLQAVEWDVKETKHIVTGIDLTTRRLWVHTLDAHGRLGKLEELKEM